MPQRQATLFLQGPGENTCSVLTNRGGKKKMPPAIKHHKTKHRGSLESGREDINQLTSRECEQLADDWTFTNLHSRLAVQVHTRNSQRRTLNFGGCSFIVCFAFVFTLRDSKLMLLCSYASMLVLEGVEQKVSKLFCFIADSVSRSDISVYWV